MTCCSADFTWHKAAAESTGKLDLSRAAAADAATGQPTTGYLFQLWAKEIGSWLLSFYRERLGEYSLSFHLLSCLFARLLSVYLSVYLSNLNCRLCRSRFSSRSSAKSYLRLIYSMACEWPNYLLSGRWVGHCFCWLNLPLLSDKSKTWTCVAADKICEGQLVCFFRINTIASKRNKAARTKN